MREITPEMLAMIRKLSPQKVAEEMINVQPIDPSVFNDLIDALGDETWVLTSGKEPK